MNYDVLEKQNLNQTSMITQQLLQKDVKQCTQLVPKLKKLSQFVNHILKQLLKKNKTHNLNYALLKKIESIKILIHPNSQIIQQQIRWYQLAIRNAETYNKIEHQFFKFILINYQNSRKKTKRNILQVEKQIQLIEDEIMQTDILSQKYYERHNILKIKNSFLKKNQIKWQLYDCLIQKMKQKFKFLKSLQNSNQNQEMVKKRIIQKNISIKNDKKNDIFQLLRLLKLFYTKNIVNKHFYETCNKQLKNKIIALKSRNQNIKKSFKLYEQKNLFILLENKINILNATKQISSDNKLTKTDYLIYIKELHQKISKIIKKYPYTHLEKRRSQSF